MTTLKKAYIILVHKNAPQLIRLIEKLNDGSSYFFIHIDVRSTIKQQDIVTNIINVIFTKRLNSSWGRFGLVQATLNAMAEIKKTMVDFDRIILLSGQDYPIKSNTNIDQFFRSSPYHIFVESALLPNFDKWAINGGLYRVNKYFMGLSAGQKLLARVFNFLALLFKKLGRNLKIELRHYQGSQWWTINSYALNYILNFVEAHPEFTRFHKYTFAPDELFFQTILMNAEDPQIAGKLHNGNKMYMQWKNEFNAHPELLTASDFDNIKRSDCLFARKFDIDADVLNLIDNHNAKQIALR